MRLSLHVVDARNSSVLLLWIGLKRKDDRRHDSRVIARFQCLGSSKLTKQIGDGDVAAQENAPDAHSLPGHSLDALNRGVYIYIYSPCLEYIKGLGNSLPMAETWGARRAGRGAGRGPSHLRGHPKTE